MRKVAVRKAWICCWNPRKFPENRRDRSVAASREPIPPSVDLEWQANCTQYLHEPLRQFLALPENNSYV